MGTFERLTLSQYCAITTIPTMCVLTIKKDENLIPLWAKSRIVVLRNHEDQIWTKSEKFAPVLCPASLHFLTSLAVYHCHTLQQGGVKNAFCNSDLPPDEITIVCPPIGDPNAPKNEYWLHARHYMDSNACQNTGSIKLTVSSNLWV